MQRRSTVFKDLALICAFLVIIGLCFKVKWLKDDVEAERADHILTIQKQKAWMDSLFKPKKDD